MEEIAISKFKATCLAVLERVRKTGQPIRVTRFGQPIAEISATIDRSKPVRRFGRHVGSMVPFSETSSGPSGHESDWEAARDPESERETKKKSK